MFSVARACGRCNQLVDFIFNEVYDHTQRTPEEVEAYRDAKRHAPGFNVTTLRSDDRVNGSALCHCPRCFGPTLIVYECSRQAHETLKQILADREGNIFGGESAITVTEVCPTPKEPDSDPNWPEEIVGVLHQDHAASFLGAGPRAFHVSQAGPARRLARRSA